MCSTVAFSLVFPTFFLPLILSTSPLEQGLFKFELCLAKQHPGDYDWSLSMPWTKALNNTGWLIYFLHSCHPIPP